jgi:hypothetical protein
MDEFTNKPFAMNMLENIKNVMSFNLKDLPRGTPQGGHPTPVIGHVQP